MTSNLLPGLEDNFDDDLSKALLDISIDRSTQPRDVVLKSLYNFDLVSTEGIVRLLSLLPIIDESILGEVYQEVFPMYPVDTLVPRTARLELRGYFMDYLDETGQTEEAIAIGSEESGTTEEAGRGAEPEGDVPPDEQVAAP